MANKVLVVVFAATLSAAIAYWGPDLPKGPFCGYDNQCCWDRQDGCSHKILDTVCYCDDFCVRSSGNDDCCPDYYPVCNQTATPPPGPLYEPCRHGGELYLPGQTRDENCNKCECVSDSTDHTTSWRCSQDPCIISEEVLRGVNQRRGGWRAANYSQFYGKKLKEGLIYKLGTLPLSPATKRVVPIRYEQAKYIPAQFDARKKWGRFISPVIDQGWCGSDWAVSLAGVASDRFAIQSNGAESMVLSPQMLLSCNEKQQQGCSGGHIDVAWNYAKNTGLVDDDCFPYKASREPRCHFKKRGDLVSDGCRIPANGRTSRYRMGPVGKLSTEQDIQYDIMTSGPVQAIMTVYQDFFHYRDGIYRRSGQGESLQGLHSVRVVGWGEDRGEKYWIVANSWGREWGENGYFRIARGRNEADIESFVVTSLSEVTEANRRK